MSSYILLEWENSNSSYKGISDLGAYKPLNTCIKEILVLDRKSKRFLSNVISTNCSNYYNQAPLRKDFINIDDFNLKLISPLPKNNPKIDHLNSKLISNISNKIIVNDSDIFRPIIELLKEKLKIVQENKEYFKDLSRLPVLEVKFTRLKNQKFKKDLETYIFPKRFDIKPKKNIQRKYDLQLMPSSLQDEFSSLSDEKLRKTVTFNDIFNERNYDNFKTTPLIGLSRFLLEEKIPCKVNDNKGTIIDLLIWNSKSSNNDDTDHNKNEETYFSNLEQKIFDVQFHELEFYKLPVPLRQNDNVRNKQKIIKTIWKLDKFQLKGMSWDPFKNIENSSIGTLLNYDKINLDKNIEIKSFKIEFHNLCTSELDLIDSTTKNFINLRFATKDPVNQKHYVDNNFDEQKVKDTTLNTNTSSTREDINTSLIPYKRSFLDADLISLMENKRRKNAKSNKNEISNIGDATPLAELLGNGIFTTNNTIQTYSDLRLEEAKSEILVDSPPNRFEPESINFPVDLSGRLIILNSNKIHKNHKLLQQLINQEDGTNGIIIIERSLSTECDFIIDISVCLLRIDLSNFFQRNESGALYYEAILKTLLSEYHKIIVFIQYSNELVSFDKEIIWKVQLYMSLPQFELYFVKNNEQQQMQLIISKYCKHSFNEDDFEQGGPSQEEAILKSFQLDPIIIKCLLQRYTLSEILNEISNRVNPFLQHVLTPSQIQRFQSLMVLHW